MYWKNIYRRERKKIKFSDCCFEGGINIFPLETAGTTELTTTLLRTTDITISICNKTTYCGYCIRKIMKMIKRKRKQCIDCFKGRKGNTVGFLSPLPTETKETTETKEKI